MASWTVPFGKSSRSPGNRVTLRSQFGQAKGDRAADHVDDLVVAVRVRGVNVMGTVRPGVRRQAFVRHGAPEFSTGGWIVIGPGCDFELHIGFVGAGSPRPYR